MPGTPYPSRVPRPFDKTITFDGTAGNGVAGTVAIGTITGAINVISGAIFCATTLVGASATLSFGLTGNAAGLIPVTTASLITAGTFWQDISPELAISPGLQNQMIGAASDVATIALILTVATATITAGKLFIRLMWLPQTPNGQLA